LTSMEATVCIKTIMKIFSVPMSRFNLIFSRTSWSGSDWH
jgi:hypothetical protein